MAERILIVEDEENLLNDLNRLVRKAHPWYEVLEAKNKTDAIQLIQSTVFGLILTDIHLDEAASSPLGGFEVLKAAKLRDPNTQVIVVTSHPSPEHIQRIRELDGFGYVDRSTKYCYDLLVREIGHAFRLFKRKQHHSRGGLLLSFSERGGGIPCAQLLGNDLVPRESSKPLVLNLARLKAATAAIGSLIYFEETDQRNALSQFVGRHIWNRLFRDHETLLLALGEAKGLIRNPSYLPIRVMSKSDALDLPLELIHDGNDYLALRHPFVRAIRGATPLAPLLPALLESLRVQGTPLRILLLASDTCSTEQGPVPAVDEEIHKIQTMIEKISMVRNDLKIEADVLLSWESNCKQVQEKLKASHHIIHYAGHGTHNQGIPGRSKLFFWENSCHPDDWRNMRKTLRSWYDVSEEKRHELAATARGLRGNLLSVTANELEYCFRQSPPSVVYLSCCHSGRAGGARHRVFSKSLGLMDAVVQTGVPIVIGHRWPLLDSESSVEFVKTFYQGLLTEHPPEQALLSARKAVQEDDPTWASAVMVVQSF